MQPISVALQSSGISLPARTLTCVKATPRCKLSAPRSALAGFYSAVLIKSFVNRGDDEPLFILERVPGIDANDA